MRKIIAVENLTLDGVMEAPEKWAFSYGGDDIAEANQAGMETTDAVLFGRVTYEEFAAYWPLQTDDQSGVAEYLTRTTKLVASSTLHQATWVNTTIIAGSVGDEIAALKRGSGGNIIIIGSATLVRSLMRDGLIDEYRLFVYPLVRGHGKRLFDAISDTTTLNLVDTRTFRAGVVLLTYQAGDTGVAGASDNEGRAS